MGMIQPLQKGKNKQNDTKGKNKSIESKFQKKFVKFNPNKSKPSNKTTLKKKTTHTHTHIYMMNKYHHNNICYFSLISDKILKNLKIDFSFLM